MSPIVELLHVSAMHRDDCPQALDVTVRVWSPKLPFVVHMPLSPCPAVPESARSPTGWGPSQAA